MKLRVISARLDWLQRLTAVSIRRPRTVLAIWLGFSVLAGFGVRVLIVDTGTSAFLDRISPEWEVYQDSLREFGGDEIVVIALEGTAPFDQDVLEAVAAFTEAFGDIDGVRRVDSIASVPVIAGRPDGSISLQPPLRRTPSGIFPSSDEIAKAVRDDRIAPRNLLSDDERLFAINVLLDSDIDRGRDRIVSEIRSILQGRRAWVSGVPVFRTEVNSRTRTELALFIPLTVALVGCVVLFVSRSLRAVWVSLGTSGIGVWCLLGAMGALDVPLSLSTMILPSVLLALGCAYVMHILVASSRAIDSCELEDAVLPICRPVGLSGLTTAIGFLAMSTVRIEAIQQLGAYGAVGVVFILVATLSVAPALLARRVRKIPFAPGVRWGEEAWCGLLLDSVLRNRKRVLAMWVFVVAVAFVGVAHLKVETDIVLWFSQQTDARRSYDAIRTRLSGITPVNVVVTAPPGRTAVDAVVLRAIAGLSEFLGSLPSVGRSLSIADPLLQLHASMRPESAGDLPQDSELVSQYLLMLESVEQLEDVLTRDRTRANILLRLKENGSRRIVDIQKEVDGWWQANGPSLYSVATTGVMYEFGRAEEDIAYGQIRGLGVALAAISGIMFMIFRRPRVALAALAPNLVPLAVGYGFMGLMRIPLDAATICIGSLVLGIAVDDTIHLTTAFSSGVEAGESRYDALSKALRRVAPALVYSTTAIAVGFLVLGLSDFSLVRNLGLVTSGLVAVCLLSDLTLLPILLVSRNPGLPTVSIKCVSP